MGQRVSRSLFRGVTSSTLAAVLAEVSMKTSPCSRANASPSSFFTSRRLSKSLGSRNEKQDSKCKIERNQNGKWPNQHAAERMIHIQPKQDSVSTHKQHPCTLPRIHAHFHTSLHRDKRSPARGQGQNEAGRGRNVHG